MKKFNAIIIFLLLVLSSAQAFALVWQEPYWLPVGTQNPNGIAFGGTATAASGAFSSIDYIVHYRAELRTNGGTLVKVLEEHDVDISVYTGYETVEVTQADYVNAGNYFVRFIISDSHETRSKQLSLTVESGPSNNPPVLNNIPDKTVYENHLLQFTVSGSDPDAGDVLSYSATNLPSGASFSPSTRTFSWTPNFDQSGTYFVTFTISDNHGATDSQTVRITVNNVNRCPTLDAIGSKSVREGDLLSFSVSGSDHDGEALSYSATGLPAGASFEVASGLFSWTPGLTQAGIYSVRFTATDGSCPASENVQITVSDNSQPVVELSATPTSIRAGQSVSFTCSVTGGDAPVNVIIDFGDGSSASQGTASHAYATDGNYTATCTASDADGNTASDTVQITVGENSVPVVDLQATPIDILEGGSVSFVCLVTGGDAPLGYYIDFGDGSSATTSAATHVYSTAAVYVASCTVTDVDSDVDSDTVGITVRSNSCPVLNHIGDKVVQAGNALTFTISATDADGNALLYYADAPFGQYLDPVTGVFSWTPAQLQTGNHLATFSVTDGNCADLETINILVTGQHVNHAPEAEFNWTPVQPLVNQDVQFQSLSTDPDGDSLTCAWDFNGDTIIDATSCSPVYRFLAPGSHTVTLTVSDGSLSDSVSHSVTVVGQLNVTGINCFSPIIEGSLESCSISVKGDGIAVGGVHVQLHYLNGDVISPSCVTDSLTGNCMISFPAPAIGNYTVYATAEKSGWSPDLDSQPRASFQVLAKRYDISNLAVYNDPGFSVEDYDFFRGEYMYVNFMVLDMGGNPADHMVTSVALVSPPGGMVYFSEYPHSYVAGNYWYSLRIPATHDFLGDSQVFTFAFNFSDGSGAQMVVQVVIRNNPPVILSGVENEFIRNFNVTTVIDLTPFESDVEDSGYALQWSVQGVDSSVAQVSVDSADKLTIVPVGQGQDIITLVLTDLDGAQDTVDVPIRVGNNPLPQCSDSIDNDGDGKIDQSDPGCSSPLDDNETDVPPVLLQCSNGLDDDHDGLVDMADPGCTNPADNDESDHPFLPQCSNGLDDDHDGLIDLADPGCSGPSDNDETNTVTYQCSDNVDNDGDGLVDMADPDCTGPSDNDESGQVGLPQCSNGLDDDHDGRIDMADPDCTGPLDNSEFSSVLPQCSDGIDNDHDGLIDLADPDCYDKNDNLEGSVGLRKFVKKYGDMDDLLVTRIDVDGQDIEASVVRPGDYLRMVVSLENTLGYDLEEVKVDASIQELGIRDMDLVHTLESGDTANVVFHLDIPEYAEPGFYDLRIVSSNDDVRRVKYRVIAIV